MIETQGATDPKPWPGPPPDKSAPPPAAEPPPTPAVPAAPPRGKEALILDRIDPSRLAEVEMGELPTQLVGLNINNVLEAWEFAKIMALAGSALPPWLRNNPGGCMYVIARALELRMSPYGIANWSYEVENKGVKRVAWESGFFQAVVNRRAPIVQRLMFEIIGEGDERRCKVWATIKGEDAPRVFISETLARLRPPMGDSGARRGSPLWDKKPEVQLAYNAMRDFARLYFADVVSGLYTLDELRDMGFNEIGPDRARDVTPIGALRARLAPVQGQAHGEGFTAATGELEKNIDAAVAAAHDRAAETAPAKGRKESTTIAGTAVPSSGDSGVAGAGAKVGAASAPSHAGAGRGQQPASEQAAGSSGSVPASEPAADLFKGGE
jgi:hypothetical protein